MFWYLDSISSYVVGMNGVKWLDNIVYEILSLLQEEQSKWRQLQNHGLMQQRCNSIANTLALCLFCIKPSI